MWIGSEVFAFKVDLVIYDVVDGLTPASATWFHPRISTTFKTRSGVFYSNVSPQW